MQYELRSLLAQLHLRSQGYYDGKLDGLWGPVSMEAARRWDDSELLAAIPPSDTASTTVSGPPTPYDLARRHIGVKEIPGSKHNSTIVRWGRLVLTSFAEDETPWCSAFVNAMAIEAGYERSGKLNARSWMNVGQTVHPSNVKAGDVVVFWRVSKDSWEGHVGFVVWRDANAGTVRVLGGNQNNSVSEATFSESHLLGYRRLRSLDRLQGPTSLV